MSEIGIKDQCFGVEIEMTGITRSQAAQALARYFETTARHTGGGYDAWTVKDPEGKEWKLMSDGSIKEECKTASGYRRTDDSDYRVEMVTPKLTYAELPKLQECVRQVRKAGAKVNNSCGIHVHVDASNHNRQSLKNLIGIMYSKEDILFKALQVNESRAERWCKKVREPMLRQARTLSSDETADLTQLEQVWYEGSVRNREHYNWTRYYALNLHSVFYRGTVEPVLPTTFYYNGIQEGYRQNGLPAAALKKAWDHVVREVHQETARINASFADRAKPQGGAAVRESKKGGKSYER